MQNNHQQSNQQQFDQNKFNGVFCQSCIMPIPKEEDYGTEIDGSKNKDYCIHCYQNGQFTEPNLTMEEMIIKIKNIMKKINMPEHLLNQIDKIIPLLKRWKKSTTTGA